MDDGDNVLSSHTGYDEVEDEADVDDMNDPAYKVDLKVRVRVEVGFRLRLGLGLVLI